MEIIKESTEIGILLTEQEAIALKDVLGSLSLGNIREEVTSNHFGPECLYAVTEKLYTQLYDIGVP